MTDSTVFSISNRINIGKMIRIQFQQQVIQVHSQSLSQSLNFEFLTKTNHIPEFSSFTLRFTEDILLPINMFWIFFKHCFQHVLN